MLTNVQIINLGLSKIGSSRISRIDPPQSSLERFCAEGYAHWKRTELGKHRWNFSIEPNYALSMVQNDAYGDQPFVYELPADCLRIIRESGSEWIQRKRRIYSAYEGLRVNYITNVDETDFDPLFTEVLACRVALECNEYVTQSNTKNDRVEAWYNAAVSVAARANAFVIGAEDTGGDDSDYAFLTGRY